jgi:hypothetical protein
MRQLLPALGGLLIDVHELPQRKGCVGIRPFDPDGVVNGPRAEVRSGLADARVVLGALRITE